MKEDLGQEEDRKEREVSGREKTSRGQTLQGRVSSHNLRSSLGVGKLLRWKIPKEPQVAPEPQFANPCSSLMVTRRQRFEARSYTGHLYLRASPLAVIWLMEKRR